MVSSVKPLTPLAATSIILAVPIWTTVCYAFVINSIQLMSLAIYISSKRSDTIGSIDVVATACIFTTHLIQMICEALMIAILVIQFLSSFDHLTGDMQEHPINWKECHRKIFPINIIVLVISLCLFLSSVNFYCIYELFAITVNCLFLLTVISLEMDDKKVLSLEKDMNYNPDIINGSKEQKYSSSLSNQKNCDYHIDICSFKENWGGIKQSNDFQSPSAVIV